MRSLRYLLIPVLAAIVCAVACETVQAQVPGLAPASPTAKPSLYATAPIEIDGTTVLHVAALASPPPGALPIETRVFLIRGAIAQLLAVDPDTDETIYDPTTFKINVTQEGNEYALVATDEHHRSPLPILTVTSVDARHADMPAAQLAQQWQAALQQMVVSALERRQPAVIERNTTFIVYGAIALVLLTIAGLIAARFMRRGLAPSVITWAIAVVWIGAITYALTLFPHTVTAGQQILLIERRLLYIWVAAFIIERILTVVIHQTVRGWATFRVAPGQASRSLLRVPTLSKALVGFGRFVVYFMAVLLTLSAINVPIASVVTIGGIAALAIGFAAQSLVRDFLNGLLVLFEDQYVVGDYVMIGNFNGVVELLTLRMVQLRDGNGNLITIPHSSVLQVVNASRNWSRVDYRVTVAATADLRKAISTVRDTMEALYRDEAWRDAILDPVEWIGVETLAAGGTTIRCRMRTAPLRQFELRREINLRMYDAFEKAGIALGSDTSPAPAVVTATSPDPQ
ncbi:MAG TPA: mechanosensitive ion channel family protein [Candidatus Aquilonibacter sp.]